MVVDGREGGGGRALRAKWRRVLEMGRERELTK